MKHLKTFIIAILCAVAGTANTAWAETVTYTISGALEMHTGITTLTITASGSATGSVSDSWDVAGNIRNRSYDLPGGITIYFSTDKNQSLVAQNGILQMQSDNTIGCYIQLSRTSGDGKRIYHYTLKEEDGDIIHEAMNAASGNRYYQFQRIDLKTIVVSYADFADIAGEAYSGSGTAGSPYIINNAMQLDLLAGLTNGGNNFSGKFFKLGDNITYTHSTDWNDASSTENNFTAIGTCDDKFCGTFDGDGHTVSGIRIYKGGGDGTSSDCQGLFGYVGSGGTVKGVNLADARITGYNHIGGIAGYTYNATIEDCTVASNVCIHAVHNEATCHGGIVGNNDGTVQRCVSAATVSVKSGLTGCKYYGGIAGHNMSTVTNCLALGAKVDAVSSYYGAITGYRSSNVNNYYSACTVGSSTTDIGLGNNDSGPSDYTNNNGAVPALRNDASNTTAIGLMAAVPASFGTYSVSLDGRTLQAGGWNTFCAPFSAAIPSGWTVMRLYSSSLSGDALTLDFLPVVSIEAGKPYLVKVESAVTNPTFSGVRVVSGTTMTETTYADFVPVMSPTYLTRNDKSVLFVTGGNSLTYPTANGNINAFRAYFQLKDAAAGVKAFNMSFEEDATSIRSIDNGQLIIDNEEEAWYSLDGVKQNGKPTAKGIYIHNGRKEAVK